jgi:hypothetical protein
MRPGRSLADVGEHFTSGSSSGDGGKGMIRAVQEPFCHLSGCGACRMFLPSTRNTTISAMLVA